MILGSFSINENDVADLGLETMEEPEEITDEELEKMIVSWATPMLSYDMPDDTKILAFMVNKFKGNPWEIAIQGLRGIDADKYNTIEWNYKQTYSTSYYNGCLSWESGVEYEEGINRIITILNSIIESGSELGTLMKQYSEIVIGDMYVIKVLYKQ